MLTFKFTVADPIGLHARPASKLVAEATKHKDATITLVHGAKKANVKSIMNLMALGVKNGQTVELQVEGTGAEVALEQLKAVIAKENLA